LPDFILGFQSQADRRIIQERVTAVSAAEAVRRLKAKYPAPVFSFVFITPAPGDKPPSKDGR
jgi:hypothetical protein